MILINVVAAAEHTPLALAIHRLATARLGALLKVGIMRASIAVVQGLLGNLVHTAALVLVISLNVPALIVSVPGADAVNRLGTLLRGALLKVVRVRASMAVVLSNGGHLVKPATLVVVSLIIMLTKRVSGPGTQTVDRLLAGLLGALHIRISVSASITVVRSSARHLIDATLLVAMHFFVILARAILAELAKAVHGLGTALRGALLEGMCVRAAVTVVGHVGGDLVDPAAPVLVVVGVMEAVVVLPPGTHAINRLAALLSGAINFVVLVEASLAIQGSLSGDRVDTAALILVTIHNMLAAAVLAPIANTVDRLSTARLGA